MKVPNNFLQKLIEKFYSATSAVEPETPSEPKKELVTMGLMNKGSRAPSGRRFRKPSRPYRG